MTDCALAPKAKETISASSTVMRFIRVGMVWAALPFAVLVVRIVFFFCCMFFVFWGVCKVFRVLRVFRGLRGFRGFRALGPLGDLGTMISRYFFFVLILFCTFFL